MNFDLDEEQAEMRDTVRRFTEQEIVPYAEAWDENTTSHAKSTARWPNSASWA